MKGLDRSTYNKQIKNNYVDIHSKDNKLEKYYNGKIYHIDQ